MAEESKIMAGVEKLNEEKIFSLIVLELEATH